jgi:hypothetical protein
MRVVLMAETLSNIFPKARGSAPESNSDRLGNRGEDGKNHGRRGRVLDLVPGFGTIRVHG